MDNTSTFIQRSSTLNIINRTGKALGAIGLDPFLIRSGKITRKVGKRYEDIEIAPNVQIGLDKLVSSINNEGKPNTFGKLAVKSLLERLLTGRYQVENVLKNCPDILQVPIKEPVFIIGMPRTGTTILHALMHEDERNRSPLSWECLLPYPIPSKVDYQDNKQIRTIEKEFGQLFKLVPDFLRKHHMAAESPQECIGITALDFNSFMFAAQLYLPSYLEWMHEHADKVSTLRFHKRFLQYLQSGGVSGQRWLLKTPIHMSRLKELFTVYPDAKIIMTHRHPAKVVPSATSLISSVRSLYSDHEDPIRSGKENLDLWANYFNRFLEDRKSLNKEDQFLDIRFQDFVKDQVRTTKNIYQHFGWELTRETEQKMNDFILRNPKDQHGKHEYTLDQFGLSESLIENKYAEYIDFLKNLNTEF